jgi:chromosome segregation ATPase
LLARTDKLEGENRLLVKENEGLKLSLESTRSETKVPELKLIQANISLKNESERCRNENSQLKRDLKGSKAEVVRLERKEQALLARTDKLEGENRLLVKENEGLKLSLESTRNEDDLQASKKECTRLQELVDSLKADQKKTNAAKDDLDRKLRASQEVETSLKAQLGDCHQLKARLEEDLKMAASKQDELTVQLNSTAGDLQASTKRVHKIAGASPEDGCQWTR